MKKLLEEKGWAHIFSCNCGGSLREHYQNCAHPQWEIRIRPTKFTYTIIVQGMRVAGPEQAYKLENKMKELGIY